MATLQPIICKLADRPTTFRQNGYNFIDGKFVSKEDSDNRGRVKSHKPDILK